MKTNYIDLATNEEFKNWVLSPNNENTIFWEKQMKNDPALINEVKKAKELIVRLKFENSSMNEEDQDILLENIIGKSTGISQPEFSIKPWYERKSFWYGMAASITLLLVSTFILIPILSDISGKEISNSGEIIEKVIPSGKKSNLTLSDGSKVKVNANSKLKFEKSFNQKNERQVYLEGEAFFDVTRNEQKPFKVLTQYSNVEVLGTSFSVRSYPSDNKEYVSVLTGKVRVSLKDKSVDLIPGQMAVMHNDGIEVLPYDLDEMISWKDGVLYYKDASFMEIVEELESWYGVQFEISGENKGLKNYSGRYKNESLETILEGLGFAAGFDYEIINKNVKINFKK